MNDQFNIRDDGQLTIESAIANLQGSDLGLRMYAAWWLGRFRVKTKPAIQALIAALEDQDDRTPAGGYPLRRNAARALGKLGDLSAVPPLLQSLGCTDFYVREAAAQALGQLGDTSAVSTLLQLLLNKLPGTLPAPEPPQLAQPFDALIEALGTLRGVEATPAIVPFLEHSSPRIQYAAARALYQLTSDPKEARQYGERLVKALSHEDLQLRRAALADLGAIGYLPAAPAIAETLAENSLKLIALRGLLEKELEKELSASDSEAAAPLSDGAKQVMELMDSLL
ncbi:MAG: HEAT repeat domain-containing protein [Cyanobacteria bacterium P01_D01_bin.71]